MKFSERSSKYLLNMPMAEQKLKEELLHSLGDGSHHYEMDFSEAPIATRYPTCNNLGAYRKRG